MVKNPRSSKKKKKEVKPPEKFYAEINYDHLPEGFHLAVQYEPWRLTDYLLEGFIAYHMFENYLESENSEIPIYLANHFRRLLRCPKHHRAWIDFQIAFKPNREEKRESLQLYEYYNLFHEFTEIGDALEWNTDEIRNAAIRAEKWIRRHLADKLHFAMCSLFIESIYAALGEEIPASKREFLQSMTSMIGKCDVLQAAKPGGDNRSKYNLDSNVIIKFRLNYKSYSTQYREANKLYRKVSSNKKWKVFIKTEYPNLEQDLIEHLADSNPYDWPPSNLAIEHSARVSIKGYKPYSLTPRQLKKYLKKTIPEIADLITD